jgi:hypothetical protein
LTAVDAPKYRAFAGLSAGEFVARKWPKRLARVAMAYVAVTGATSIAFAARHPLRPGAEFAMVLPLMCISMAAVCLAVRQATVRITKEGIRWGWTVGGFSVGKARIDKVIAYRDAVAIRPRRGSLWYLGSSDWKDFAEFADAFENAELPIEVREDRAPFRARVQSYGRVLDAIVVVNVIVMTAVVLGAAAL